MSSVNKAILIGNLGKDPEVRSMQSGDKVANFSIATSERWTDKASGEKKEKTEWHNIVVWNQGLVKIVEQYLKKGSKVYVEGQLATRKWTDKNGTDKYSTEVVLKPFRGEIVMLSGKDGAAGGNVASDDGDQQYDAPAAGQTQVDMIEDEIPF